MHTRISTPADSSNGPLGRRLWRVLLTGLPYGVFKAGAGIAAWEDVHPAAGVAMMLWGLTDVLLNLLHVAFPRRVSYCVLSNIGLVLDRGRAGGRAEAVALALDTLLSFAIVATMIWFGRLSGLPKGVLTCWELAVISNVLGVGVERLYSALRITAARQPTPERP